MRVGVEAVKLLQEKRGIGRYVRSVLRAMVRERADVRFTYFTATGDQQALRAQLADFDSLLAERATTAPIGTLADAELDVIWYPWNYLHPLARKAAMVTTICDLVPMLRFDHRWWKIYKRAKYRRRFRRTLQHSDVVITISAFTAREVAQHFGVSEKSMRVTLLAADALPVSTSPLPESVRANVRGPFFVAVGASEPRKNLTVILDAMRYLQQQGTPASLVLCGPGAKLAELARESGVHDVHCAGYVSDSELAALYRESLALIFPSRYEGFGLPPLEAMASGGRVICADTSSLPEVVGDAALRFPWDDSAALAAAMQRMEHDAALRAQLTHAGASQAATFSWERTARETFAAFDEAIARRAARR